MGIDPDVQLKEEFLDALREDSLLGLKPATEKEARVLYYLKAKLQLDDTDLLNQITQWYKRKGWTEALEMGGRLYQWISEVDPRRPEEIISVFVKCMNELHRGTARFELAQWEQVASVPFIQKGVVIRVSPPD